MVTLQDISIQLMKPAKDLADWKFPLSQILEEYYALLEEPCNINFGEAALVLQNSANVYVRRVERLFNETEALRQTFFGYEEEEIKKSLAKEKKGLKKSYVNFDNFVIIDLEEGTGKNIDKKSQLQQQPKIKLLSHRFTQLENNMTQLCIPIEVYDVLGEVIGKKYDFRCNQAVSTTGMLVDELTLQDFTGIVSSHVQKGRNSLSSYSEPKTPGTGTSGYHSAASPNHSIASAHEDCENDHNFTSQVECVPSLNDSEDTLNKDTEVPFADTSISNIENNLFNEQDTQPNEVENINNNDTNQSKKKYRNDNSERVETNDGIDYKRKRGRVRKDQVVRLSELNNAQEKEEVLNTRKRGNRATKKSIHFVDDINELDWKPMPLVQGMRKVFSHNTSVLKLPEHISLLKANTDSKKRKLASKIHNSECLTKLILRETELRARKDIVIQARPKFKHLQKREVEEFMRNFDQCFSGTEKGNDITRHTSVTNFTINLMGYCSSPNRNDFVEHNDEDVTSRSSSPVNMKSQSHQDSHTMEKSPDLNNSWCESFGSEMNSFYSLPDYQTLIEDKMKEIFEETDNASELDQTVAKWHASLQPKLLEAEIRPPFRIHDYASRIINTLQAVEQKKINFDSVVRDKPACEVARYFVASLQLANSYSVEIRTENNDKSIEMKLLNDEKCCEKK